VLAARHTAARSRGTTQPLHRAELGWVGLPKNFAPARIERRRGNARILLGLSCVVRMLGLWRRALALGAPLWFPAACRVPPCPVFGRAAPCVRRSLRRSLRSAPGVGAAPASPPPPPGPPPLLLPRRFVSLRAANVPYSPSFSFIINRWLV